MVYSRFHFLCWYKKKKCKVLFEGGFWESALMARDCVLRGFQFIAFVLVSCGGSHEYRRWMLRIFFWKNGVTLDHVWYKCITPAIKMLIKPYTLFLIFYRDLYLVNDTLFFPKILSPHQSTHYRGASRKDKPKGRHHGLSQQKRQEIKEAFELFDTDGSGIEIICCCVCNLFYF